MNEDRAQTMSMAFCGPGDRFVTVGADPKVFVYDVETKKRIAELEATYVHTRRHTRPNYASYGRPMQ